MNYVQSEALRHRDKRQPGWFQWHVVWALADARNELLGNLHSRGLPALLACDLSDLGRFNYRLAYGYKVRPEVLPFWLGLRRWVSEINAEAEDWLA